MLSLCLSGTIYQHELTLVSVYLSFYFCVCVHEPRDLVPLYGHSFESDSALAGELWQKL